MVRLEDVKMKEARTQAKIIGTLVTFSGALLMTLYKGPAIDIMHSHPTNHDANSSSNKHWVVGTILILIGCSGWSAFYILQVSNVLLNLVLG